MSMSALVVDDDEFVRLVLARQLERAGFGTVECTADGRDALDLLRGRRPFDVIISDLLMPGIDGVGLLRALGQMEAPPPLILMSGADPRLLGAALKLAEAYGLQAMGALPKPVSSQSLHQLLLKLVSRGRPSAGRVAPRIDAEELSAALARAEIGIAVQPKVSPEGPVNSVEVLARWNRPCGDSVSPEVFIAIAEQSGLIGTLTEQVMIQALVARQKWTWDGFHIAVAINLPMQMLDNLDLPERMEQLVTAHGACPGDVTFEVTESGHHVNMATALDVLMQLRLKGFPISLDDFGTGYSSCSRLQNGPFTELKIDRSFVASMVDDPESHSIVESHVRLARDLGLSVVAEGVETESQALELSLLGCDLLQGYHLARPMPPQRFSAWMRERSVVNRRENDAAMQRRAFDLMAFVAQREERDAPQ